MSAPTKHTPDWRARGTIIYDEDGDIVCDTGLNTSGLGAPPNLRIEFADQIVRAVNAHADLLAACEALVRSIEPQGFDPTTEQYFRTPLKAARAAITRAKGETP